MAEFLTERGLPCRIVFSGAAQFGRVAGMQFLIPVGGVVDPQFGVLTSYAHRGVPAGIGAGLAWAADNCAYGGRFRAERFLAFLARMAVWRATCLFVTAPDVVADCEATLALFEQWRPALAGWPVAFVAQDGQEERAFPAGFDVLFVGGSTAWKTGPGAVACIRRARSAGKHIHVGRVNWRRRYDFFNLLEGGDGFTCDGTRTRFEGTATALAAWGGYQAQLALFRGDPAVPGGDCGG